MPNYYCWFKKFASQLFVYLLAVMMKFLPLFPLGLVAYPGEQVNLHIFEPRYKELINECFNKQVNFGMLPYFKDDLKEYGCIMKVTDIHKRYSDGKLDIKTEGTGIFRMIEFIKKAPNKLYSGAIISNVVLVDDAAPLLFQKCKVLANELFTVLNLDKSKIKNSSNSFQLAHHIGFTIDQEYELLTVKQERVRIKLIYEHLKKIIPVVKEAEMLKEKVKLNGHFKNIIPPM